MKSIVLVFLILMSSCASRSNRTSSGSEFKTAPSTRTKIFAQGDSEYIILPVYPINPSKVHVIKLQKEPKIGRKDRFSLLIYKNESRDDFMEGHHESFGDPDHTIAYSGEVKPFLKYSELYYDEHMGIMAAEAFTLSVVFIPVITTALNLLPLDAGICLGGVIGVAGALATPFLYHFRAPAEEKSRWAIIPEYHEDIKTIEMTYGESFEASNEITFEKRINNFVLRMRAWSFIKNSYRVPLNFLARLFPRRENQPEPYGEEVEEDACLANPTKLVQEDGTLNPDSENDYLSLDSNFSNWTP